MRTNVADELIVAPRKSGVYNGRIRITMKLELALAAPTSPRQLLLARLVLVFGYNLAPALVATVGLVAVVPPLISGASGKSMALPGWRG